ncbi:MAG: ATP-binding protein [Oleiphilaceae bacterium]|nr:ATP-binding protein [Oleiphilaceae bacterium]
MPSSLFTYFNLYRVVISALLWGVTFSKKYAVSDFRDIEAFQVIAATYFVFSLVSLLAYRSRLKADDSHIFFFGFLDLCFLHALFYAGEGITGGLSNLVIISVAAANIMLRGLSAYALAAVASLLSLTLEFDRYIQDMSVLSDVARAGLFGAIYFATAFILQNLSRRISQTEELAAKQQKNIAELQALNHQIIQSMRTGIIVCDPDYKVLTFNQACSDLLGMKSGERLPQQIIERIDAWSRQPTVRSKPFQMSADLPEVQANFSRMENAGKNNTLIFLEDTRLLTQRAQQLKLASLGRLTASIAHEVRNPLGAISHAAQLLSESEELTEADRKMTSIIERHCARVNGIIENTLTLSRRGQPDVQAISLRPWLEQVVDQCREQSDSPILIRVNVLNKEDTLARFDPSQIEQVLTNLIVNAQYHIEKSMNEGGVEVCLSRKAGTGQAIVDVIDSGNGVSEENQKHLFEPFFTTESTGTGLGLYISRELCEANQANLSYLESSSGGACFRIIFAHHKRIV